jgi:hypothetical protein
VVIDEFTELKWVTIDPSDQGYLVLWGVVPVSDVLPLFFPEVRVDETPKFLA